MTIQSARHIPSEKVIGSLEPVILGWKVCKPAHLCIPKVYAKTEPPRTSGARLGWKPTRMTSHTDLPLICVTGFSAPKTQTPKTTKKLS